MIYLAFSLPTEALQYGFIGMGVLLAFLALYAFFQAMNRNLTKGRIIMFCVFLAFSLAMSLLGFFAERLKSADRYTIATIRNGFAYVRRDIALALDEKEGFIKRLEQSTQPIDEVSLQKAKFAANTLRNADKALDELKVPEPLP